MPYSLPWEMIAAILTAFCAAFTLKKLLLDKLWERFGQKLWAEESKDVIKRMQAEMICLRDEIDNVRGEQRSNRVRIEGLENDKDTTREDINEIKLKVNLISTGLFALLMEDDALKDKAKTKLRDSIKFH